MAVRACTLAAVLLLAQAAEAQTPQRFEGRVVHAVTGAPVHGATVSVVGVAGASLTDRDGRFTWSPAPPHPFELIVTMPGRQAGRPVTIDDAKVTEPTTITVAETVAEAVMVLGAAPSIDWTPAAAATIVGGTQIAERHAEHLAQALATVPGVGRISEGHAAVPAVRGLARGRTLILVDGARVDAERRTGPSATFLDLSIVEQVEVARGPASVAYGSDALGGVISVRTRQAEPGAPLHGRFSGTAGAGVPDRGASGEVSKGLPRGGLLVQAHARQARDYDSPDGTVPNSGWEDHGVLAHATHAAGDGVLSVVWQSDEATDVGRPRSDSSTVRFYYPFERSRRLTSTYQAGNVAGFHRVALTGFWGASSQRTDQDRPATATSVRRIERADVSAHDVQARGTAERQAGRARLIVGLDVHGRTGLHALDLRRTFDASGGIAEDRENVSVDDARRMASGGFLQADTTLGPRVRLAGGIRGDHVATRNEGGYLGDRATTHTAVSGNLAVTVAPVDRLTLTTQVSRGFRDPVLSDRYFRGPSGRGFITGNPETQARDEPAVRCRRALRHQRVRTGVALRLPVRHRRSRRALRRATRLVHVPQPRSRPPARRRSRGPGLARRRLDDWTGRRAGARQRPRRRHLSRRRIAGLGRGLRAQGLRERTHRVRAGRPLRP